MLKYSAFNTPVITNVPSNALSILDVGCGTGVMGKTLKEQKKERIVNGVTYSREEYEIAKLALDHIWITDINSEIPCTTEKYDCIIFSHVLEHTFHPDEVLANFCSLLKKEGTVIIALPNILHFKQRMVFLKGKFEYSEKGGLMDKTHFRFFDWNTAQLMIRKAGLKIITKEAIGNFPLPLLRKLVPSISRSIDKFSVRKWPGMFGFQFVYTAIKEKYS